VGPPIPNGSRIRFADATHEQLLGGVASSATSAREGFAGGVADAALIFSCAGRHGFPGTRVRREFELLGEHLASRVPTIGFYTYDEFCPLSGSVIPRAHSSTFVSVLIAEYS
jgi:hypothetical protein